jgi:hypothetical protein
MPKGGKCEAEGSIAKSTKVKAIGKKNSQGAKLKVKSPQAQHKKAEGKKK